MQGTWNRGSRNAAAWGLALVALGSVLEAQAAVVTVGNRAALAGPTSTVDWSVLGGDGSTIGASAVVGGVTVTGAPAFTVWQQAPTGSWSGNFSDGDSLLSLFDTNGAGALDGVFDIALGTAVSGFGTQVQDYFFGSFNVNVKLFDAASVQLGSFDFTGNSTADGDGSALFVGFQSDALNISRIVISGMTAGSAINQLTLGTGLTGNPNPTPVPATMALVLAGLALMRLSRPQGR